MELQRIFKKNKEIVVRNIEGQVIIMPLYRSSREINCIYTLNETAAAAWDLIDGKRDLGQTRQELLLKFDVEEKTLTKDLAAFIKDLKSIKAVV